MMYPAVWLGSARECGSSNEGEGSGGEGTNEVRTGLQTHKPEARRLPTKLTGSIDIPSISLDTVPVFSQIGKDKGNTALP